jgi:hypothetical protein
MDAPLRFRRGEQESMPALYGEVVALLEREGALFDWWEGIPAANRTTLPGMPPLIERYLAGAARLQPPVGRPRPKAPAPLPPRARCRRAGARCWR